MYATAIKREKQKLQKQIAKRKPREVASSDSDDDISLSNVKPAKLRKSLIKSKTRTMDKRSSTKAKIHTTDEQTLTRKRRAQEVVLQQEEDKYQKKLNPTKTKRLTDRSLWATDRAIPTLPEKHP
jgi:hypothetical protein